MPKLVNKLPKYSLHKATGQAKVRHQGKDHYLGKHGSPEAWDRYLAFCANLPKPEEEPTSLPEPTPGSNLLVREVVAHHYMHAKTYYVRNGKPTGEHLTIRSALRPLKQHFGDLPAKDFGPKKLKKLQQIMIELNWSRRFINKAVNIARRAFKWAASEELIPGSIPEALKTVEALKKGRTAAREKPEVTAVADDVVDATLPELPSMIADMVRVQRLTGMRPGEILAMTADEIDRTDSESWVYTPAEHKTAHHEMTRTVIIGPRAIAILAPWLLQAGTGRIFQIERDGYRQAIIRACARAFPHPEVAKILAKEPSEARKLELKAWRESHKTQLKAWDTAHAWHPNRLRHSFATQVRREHGLEAAQVLLGHSRADVTQVYAERDVKKAQDVARKIG